ncbi:MAG: 30S ribosomal protein S16 [Brevibacterium sp.]|nr:30S ribosomal protein S16 [Brevibacterium sp.]
MAVKIRLKRMGKIRAPHYRVVVADSRTRRDGKAIEQIGIYHPTRNPSVIEINSERAQHWLSVGAQPTDQVRALLKLTGDWQQHTGIGEAVNTVKGQSEKEAYVAPTVGSVIKEAITPKGDKAAEDAAPAASEESAEA